MIAQRIRLVRTSPTFRLDGLAVPRWAQNFGIRVPMTYEDIDKQIRSVVHVDGREIVEWMLDALASNVWLDGFVNEYSTCSSDPCEILTSNCDDAFDPGVSIRSSELIAHFENWEGVEVQRRGYGIADFYYQNQHIQLRVPAPHAWAYRIVTIGGVPRIFEGLIDWVNIGQWLALLLAILKPPFAPIRRRVRFPRAGATPGPIHFATRINIPLSIITIKISTTKDTTIRVVMRDYTTLQERMKDEVEIQQGQNEVQYVVYFPGKYLWSLEPTEYGKKLTLVLDSVTQFPF